MLTQNPVTLDITAQRYLTAIRAAGIPVPEELADGVRAAGWKPDPAVTRESFARLVTAKTEADFKAAYAVVAQETAAQLAMDSGRMSVVREGYQQRRIMDPVYSTADQVFREVIARFNAEVPTFEAAASRIPDLTGLKPMDISPDVATAIAESKASAGVLLPLWEVYRIAGRLTERFTVGEVGEAPSWYDQLSAVFALGEPEDMAQAQSVAMLLFEYAQSHQGLTLSALAPFIALTVKGVRLELVDPETALDRWEDCKEPEIVLSA